ncbi:MAG: hypothetical protein DMG71_01240 [Acidobacteria bacterium]|nr:MAG: hypothetical protein DMG71_01240 [Acidobacteriota bacterium]
MAGNVLLKVLQRDQVIEHAFVAGVWAFWVIKVDAREGVLENGCGFPRGTDGAAIASLLQKAQFELQDLQDVAFLLSHGSPRRPVTAKGGLIPYRTAHFGLASTGAL